MIILATHALADTDDMMLGFAARCGPRPRGRKDEDAAVPLDVALERAPAVASMDWLMRGDAEIQRSSRTSALRTVDSVVILTY